MSDPDAWVGTWRPHRPRRPIAAFYAGPGPKYALPGLTGNTNHDPTRNKAPMFSFGIRQDQTNADFSPGPRYLIPSNITKTGRDGKPAFSLHSRTTELASFPVPGPGHYSPERSEKCVIRSAPAYSLAGRSKFIGDYNKIPGPASYTLPPVLGSKSAATTAAPSYSLSGRSKIGSFYEDLKKTPGPAVYKVVDPGIYKYKSPLHSMTGRNFPPGDTTKKPGPGAHSPERVTITKSQAPSFTFGLRHSQYIFPVILNVAD